MIHAVVIELDKITINQLCRNLIEVGLFLLVLINFKLHPSLFRNEYKSVNLFV